MSVSQSPQETASIYRERLLQLVDVLSHHFVHRRHEVEMIVTAAAAGEPILLLGEPGTGKSDLVRQFCAAMELEREEYFEYLLTKFTEPAELFGPIDLQKLREGQYIRRTEHKLPQAKVVFLDEIFQSNSGILNHLLTVLQERVFYQDGIPRKVNLEILFGASNSLPSFPEVEGLKDRFPLKLVFRPVHSHSFRDLIVRGSVNEVLERWSKDRPSPLTFTCPLEGILQIRQFLDQLMFGSSSEREKLWQHLIEDMEHYWEEGVFELFEDMIHALEKDLHIHISDRTVIKLYRLLRTYGFLFRGGTVRREDLLLLQHIGNREEDFEGIAEHVRRMVGVAQKK